MLRRIVVAGVGLAVLVACGIGLSYQSWLEETRLALVAGSEVVQTARGPIEVSRAGGVGPTLLLVHGTPGGYDQVLPLAAAAERAGYRSLAVSRPGYLRTPLAVGRSPAEQADAYAALLDALGLPSVAVVGVSGGGPSAIEFARRHPERCWALVDLMGVSRAPLPDELLPARELDGGVMARVLASDFGGFVLHQLADAFPDQVLAAAVPNAALAARIRDDPAKRASFRALVSSGLRLAGARAAGTANDLDVLLSLEPAVFSEIAAPTLVLHGTADVNVPIAMAREVAAGVPGAELVEFEGADHMMIITHDDEVLAALFDFLARHRPS